MPRFLTLACLTLLALPASAQTPGACLGGFATLPASVPGAPTQGPFPCEGVDLLAYVPTCVGSGCTTGPLRASRANDIWGWTDPETGREYALVGMVNGTVFVDVTEPTAPEVLGKLAARNGLSSVWRDMKVYQNHAFIVADGSTGHGMQVFDLTTLRGLTADPARNFTALVNFDGPAGTTVSSKHNIAINEATGFAYLVGGSSCAGGLYMVDIRTPSAPAFAGCYAEDAYTHDTQCITYDGPDATYTGREICLSSNEDTLTITDVTDKSVPTLIARGFYPSPGYTHQGWLTEDRRYFLIDDELDEVQGSTIPTRTIVFDVSDLDNPQFAFSYLGARNTSDHNLYIRGRYGYLSTYNSGLRIVDLAGIAAGDVQEVASFDTYPQNDDVGFDGQWSNYPYFASGTIIANDRGNGLFVLRATDLLVSGAPAPAPGAFALSEPTPNPASDAATLALSVEASEHVRAVLLDATGREVAVVFDGTVQNAVTLAVDTRALAAGAYVVRVAGETFSAARRLSVVR